MPSGRSKIQYRVVCTGDGGREWRVYKLRRQYRLFKKVRLWSNARLELHVPDKKPRKPEFLRREADGRVLSQNGHGIALYESWIPFLSTFSLQVQIMASGSRGTDA